MRQYELHSCDSQKHTVTSHNSDFSDRDRAVKVLIQYFGEENVIPVTNFAQLQLRSLIKDVSRLHNLPFDEINTATGKIETEVLGVAKQEPGFDRGTWTLTFEAAMTDSPTFQALMEKYPEFQGTIKVLFKQIRGLSRHAGGVLITENSREGMPLIKAGGELQTPWPEGVNYRHLEEFGLLKFDILGLGTLRMFENCVRRILQKTQGIKNPTFKEIKTWFDANLHPDNNPMSDRKVYENVFWDGRWCGVFQFVSKNVQDFMQQMKPLSINDIAVATAIFRPGPLGLKVDRKFLNNRANPDGVVFKHPALREVYADTSGLLIFQEQLMLTYNKLCGVPLDETDGVRKAFTKKEIGNTAKAEAARNELRESFKILSGAHSGLSEEVAGEIFDEMEKLVAYSFNKCLGKNTMVETVERGIVPITAVKIGDHVHSKNGPVTVKDLHQNGPKKLYKVKTRGGRTLSCTMDHKLETPDGMKTLKEILDNRLPIICQKRATRV